MIIGHLAAVKQLNKSDAIYQPAGSKCFRRLFLPFEAFLLLAIFFFALAPILVCPKREKCFKPEESPTKPMATRASRQPHFCLTVSRLLNGLCS